MTFRSQWFERYRENNGSSCVRSYIIRCDQNCISGELDLRETWWYWIRFSLAIGFNCKIILLGFHWYSRRISRWSHSQPPRRPCFFAPLYEFTSQCENSSVSAGGRLVLFNFRDVARYGDVFFVVASWVNTYLPRLSKTRTIFLIGIVACSKSATCIPCER